MLAGVVFVAKLLPDVEVDDLVVGGQLVYELKELGAQFVRLHLEEHLYSEGHTRSYV